MRRCRRYACWRPIGPESSEVTVDDAVDRIAQLVIVANFDVNKLTPERIADLQQDGCDLRRIQERTCATCRGNSEDDE